MFQINHKFRVSMSVLVILPMIFSMVVPAGILFADEGSVVVEQMIDENIVSSESGTNDDTGSDFSDIDLINDISSEDENVDQNEEVANLANAGFAVMTIADESACTNKSVTGSVDGANATLIVPDGACPVKISFSSYSHTGYIQPFDEQILTDNITNTYGPGTYNLGPINLSCNWQSDLYYGEVQETLNPVYGHSDIIAYDYVQNQNCDEPIPPQTNYCTDGNPLTYENFLLAKADGYVSYDIEVDENTNKAKVVLVNKSGCEIPMSLSSYKMYETGGILSTQKFFDGTGLVNAGDGEVFEIDIPTCMSQIDFWYGLHPQVLSDGINYGAPFSEPVVVVLDWSFARMGNLCTDPNPETPPVTPPGNSCINKVPTGSISIDGKTATLIIPEGACPIKISFSSYTFEETVRPFDEQILVDNITDTYGPGTYEIGPIEVACKWQSDLYGGEVQTDLNPDYGHSNLIFSIYDENPDCNTPPVITLIGPNPYSITVGQVFNDNGAVAIDLEDGNITSDIVTTGVVNTSIAGTYIIEYSVTDSGGLSASTTRVVNVTNPSGPSDPTKGKISMCLVLADSGKNIATSSNGLPAGLFTIKLATSTNFLSTTIFSKTWNTETFSPNTRIILGENDADCISINDLEVINHIYSELEISGSLWNDALYSDQFTISVNDLDDFYPYNSVAGGDNSDGEITLIPTRKDRTLVILVTHKDAPTPPPVPAVTLNANPSSITLGATSTLTWTSINTDSCSAVWTNASSTSGTQDVAPGVTTEYSISCTGTNGTVSATTTVTVTSVITPPGGGGEGGGGGGGSSSGGRRRPVVTGEILGATSCLYLIDYIKIDWVNDPIEVLKVQSFLNVFENENLSYTGVYNQATFEAVERFQRKYASDILTPWGDKVTTGFVYILTKKKINEIYCNTIYPLSQGDQNEIDAFRNAVWTSGASGNTGFNSGTGTTTTKPNLGALLGDSIDSIADNISDVLNGSAVVELKDSSSSALRNAAISLFSLPQRMFDKLFQGCGYTPTLLFLILIALVVIIIKLFTNSARDNEPKSPITNTSTGHTTVKDSPVIVLPGVMPDEEIIIENPEEGPDDVLVNTPDLRPDQNQNKKS